MKSFIIIIYHYEIKIMKSCNPTSMSMFPLYLNSTIDYIFTYSRYVIAAVFHVFLKRITIEIIEK